jgi:hypothetical protein
MDSRPRITFPDHARVPAYMAGPSRTNPAHAQDVGKLNDHFITVPPGNEWVRVTRSVCVEYDPSALVTLWHWLRGKPAPNTVTIDMCVYVRTENAQDMKMEMHGHRLIRHSPHYTQIG